MFTPDNKMANSISNAMENIKLDSSVNYAETQARINKHANKEAAPVEETAQSGDLYLKNSSAQDTLEPSFTSYEAQTPAMCQNYSPYMAQTYCAQASSAQAQPSPQSAQSTPPEYTPQAPQNYGQAQYSSPACQQYQTYQAPAQYAQTQALSPAI